MPTSSGHEVIQSEFDIPASDSIPENEEPILVFVVEKDSDILLQESEISTICDVEHEAPLQELHVDEKSTVALSESDIMDSATITEHEDHPLSELAVHDENEISSSEYDVAVIDASTECQQFLPELCLEESTVGSNESALVTEQDEVLPDLIVLKESVIKEVPLKESRRMVDLARFVEEIREIERHSMECNHGGILVHVKTVQIGMTSALHYRCCKVMCPVTKVVRTSVPESIHLDAVLGTIAVGIGYRQAEEFFATMQSPFISDVVYQKYERQSSDVLESCQKESTSAAIEEEKNMARLAGNVDDDGNVCITAVVDGGWSKRSYGHTYNAKSGAAVIIGDQTKKVLFAGTRNKFCRVCTLAQNKGVDPNEHECNSNWNGSSTAMEADIIVEGLKWLQNEHGVLCTRVIGDGDSSVMSAIRDNLKYGDRVEKIECANHALKNFRKKLEAAAVNSKAFRGKNGLKARQLLQAKTKRLAKEARRIIKKHAISRPKDVTSDAIVSLSTDLENMPFHIFGQHDKCNVDSRCRESQEKNHVPLLKTVPNFFESVEEATGRLSSLSNSLIYNVNSNLAEHFMSAKAKAIGGKRVDFSQGQGYARRVKAATLAYNKPGQAWHINVHRACYKRGPTSPLKKLVMKRQRRLESDRRANAKRKLAFRDDSDNDESEQTHKRKRVRKEVVDPRLDYGSCDLEPQQLKSLCDSYYQKHICVTDEKRKEIEEGTRMQGSGTTSEKDFWFEVRTKRLSASNIFAVCHRRPTTLSANLVDRLVYPSDIQNEATKYGHFGERKAKQKYSEKYGVTVENCGVMIDMDHPFLCASPDGIVRYGSESYLLEVKSPYIARMCSSIDAAMEIFGNKIPLSKDEKGKYFLPKSHSYYCQVQVQLQCSNLDRCDYIVYLLSDMAVVTIQRDKKFMQGILLKIEDFYMECILPELADSRRERNLPLREPRRILDAIAAAKVKKQQKDERARKSMERRKTLALKKQQNKPV